MYQNEFLLRMQHAVRSGSLGHRLLKGGGWAAVGKVGTITTGFITNALITRILSPDEVGTYYLALSIIIPASLVAQLGVGKTAIRLLGEARGESNTERIKAIVATVLKIGLGGILVVAIAYLLIGRHLAISVFNSVQLRNVTLFVSLITMLMALGDLFADTFRGLHDFRFAELFGGKGLLKSVLISLGFGILWLVKGDTTLVEVFLVMVASGTISAALAFWMLQAQTGVVRNIDKGLPVPVVMAIAWPILLTSLIPVVSSQGTLWILGGLRSSSEVAIFGTVMKLVTLMSIPALLYGQVVSAFIPELYAQGRRALLERMLRSVANLTTAVTGTFAVILLFWGEEILGLVYGNYYRTGNLVLALLVVAQLVNVVTGPCGQLLLMTGYQQSFFKITFIAGGFAIAVSLWLIRPFGYLGAAIGQMTYTIVTTILAAYLGYRLTGVKSWVGWYRERK